jgi:hypothetical protein
MIGSPLDHGPRARRGAAISQAMWGSAKDLIGCVALVRQRELEACDHRGAFLPAGHVRRLILDDLIGREPMVGRSATVCMKLRWAARWRDLPL